MVKTAGLAAVGSTCQSKRARSWSSSSCMWLQYAALPTAGDAAGAVAVAAAPVLLLLSALSVAGLLA